MFKCRQTQEVGPGCRYQDHRQAAFPDQTGESAAQ